MLARRAGVQKEEIWRRWDAMAKTHTHGVEKW
jgi:hypothetical protein